VAEPPSPALAWLVAVAGPVEAAARVRRGAVSEEVVKETAARRHVDRAAEDLAVARACGARIITPEHGEWPHWAFAVLDNVAFGHAARAASVDDTADLEAGLGHPDRDGLGPAGAIGAGLNPTRRDLAPPLALWVRGPGIAAELCDQSAAIVGARAATSYGTYVAGELGAGLAAAGFTVVSGAAIGIDGAAHRGALAAGGPTVAVLACGSDRSYPAAHEALLERIAATGLVVSEYPPASVPARHRFLVRNRLIAALAGGTVVVEAALRSGAQRTAADAQALGRPVMAVPGPVTSGQSAGCHRLVREGAVLVTRIEEVLEEVGRIGVHLAEEPTESALRPTDGLGPAAMLVHDALPTRAARGVAWLAMESGLPPGAVRAALAELAGRGLVEQGGGRWQRTIARSR
jgi:DNA processing protein